MMRRRQWGDCGSRLPTSHMKSRLADPISRAMKGSKGLSAPLGNDSRQRTGFQSMMPMTQSDLPLRQMSRGKVRDVYAVDADRLLLVATDRVSAFDVVMGEAVPFKGQVLTQMSAWWCRQLEGVVSHHMISADADEIVAEIGRAHV